MFLGLRESDIRIVDMFVLKQFSLQLRKKCHFIRLLAAKYFFKQYELVFSAYGFVLYFVAFRIS